MAYTFIFIYRLAHGSMCGVATGYPMTSITELTYDLTRQYAVLQLSRDNRLNLALGLLQLEETARELARFTIGLGCHDAIRTRSSKIVSAVECLIATQGERSDVNLWMSLMMVSDRSLKLLSDMQFEPVGAPR
jgi:hypothetical protein